MKQTIKTTDGVMLTTSGNVMGVGREFTIDGCGLGKNGERVIGGRCYDRSTRGRKMKAETLTVYKVERVLGEEKS